MNSLFPLVSTPDLAAARSFYCGLLDLAVAFENDWYVQLQHPENPAVQLAFIDPNHESVPEPYRSAPAGVIVTIELDDARAACERAKAQGLELAVELRDEVWGQRHFMVTDPCGLLVDIVELIEPSEEFAASYSAPAGGA